MIDSFFYHVKYDGSQVGPGSPPDCHFVGVVCLILGGDPALNCYRRFQGVFCVLQRGRGVELSGVF